MWTTTPWTLVSNVALAVHPDLDYVELAKRNQATSETIILAASRAHAVLGDDYTDRWETVGRMRGSDSSECTTVVRSTGSRSTRARTK